MAVVVTADVTDSRRVVQYSFAVAAACHPYAVYSRNAQRFTPLRPMTTDHASVPIVVRMVPGRLRNGTVPRYWTRRCTAVNICGKQMYS